MPGAYGMAGGGGDGQDEAHGQDELGYTAAQLDSIRRVQRSFRAQLSRQAEAAQELHHTSLREASSAAELLAGAPPQHAHLCDILRRVYRERKLRGTAQPTPTPMEVAEMS